MNLCNIFQKNNDKSKHTKKHKQQCCKCANCKYYKSIHQLPIKTAPTEQTYEQKKAQMIMEKQIEKELEDAEWDTALERIRIKMGLENFESLSCFQRFIRCLQFHKLYDDVDNEITTYILMRLFSALFLEMIAKLCGLTTIITISWLIFNSIFCWTNILSFFNIYSFPLIKILPWNAAVFLFFVGVICQIFGGLFMAASKGIEKSKKKSFIGMVFGFVIAIIVGIATCLITI